MDPNKDLHHFFESGFCEAYWPSPRDPSNAVPQARQALDLLGAQGGHILDWRGGWGSHSLYIAQRGFKVTLLDFSQRYMNTARACSCSRILTSRRFSQIGGIPRPTSRRIMPSAWETPFSTVLAHGHGRFARCIAVLVTVSVCLTCMAETSRFVDTKGMMVNVWELTRESDMVVVADVTSVDTTITVVIDQVLKGQTDDTTITFAAPPRPVPQPKRICCPPPPGWSLAVGEKWVLFFRKTGGCYCFTEGRSLGLVETLASVRQFQDFQALTNDVDKVKRLVKIVSDPPGMSSHPAFMALAALNRPEHLDLLTPLAEQMTCRWAYISLLRDNGNPRTIDLLRDMLRTESGDNLRQVMDAFGRKEQHNEDISNELLSFLDHKDPAIRSTAVFILNCRDFRNGFPRILKALDDPDPGVRASALAWPWYAYVRDHPEVKARIKKLRYDADPNVRDAAKRALAGMSTWYRLWYYHR